MSIEIEKKYSLTRDEFEYIAQTLAEIEAKFVGENFEENILYGGGIIAEKDAVLRVRKVSGKTLLTFKQRIENESEIKHHVEYETQIDDAYQFEKIIENLGFEKSLIYEKRRKIWEFQNAEIVLDELPFGLFMEIEGSVPEIKKIENLLGAEKFKTEHETYPVLTAKLGRNVNKIIEARFA